MNAFVERILNDESFAKKYGELGPVYGKQWRAWETTQGEPIDQLQNLIDQIKTNPDSRRLILIIMVTGIYSTNGFATMSYIISILCA